MMLYVCYPKCSTCKKAEQYLNEKKVEIEVRDIKLNHPNKEELRDWIKRSDLDMKRFFNTSGLKYKELNLKEKLPLMSEEEKLDLLASDGMLVKRPILVSENFVLVGFKQKEWDQVL